MFTFFQILRSPGMSVLFSVFIDCHVSAWLLEQTPFTHSLTQSLTYLPTYLLPGVAQGEVASETRLNANHMSRWIYQEVNTMLTSIKRNMAISFHV